MGSESWSVDRSPTNGRVGLQLVESEGPAGPALVGASGDWQMRIPAGWRDCRAKHLAALRRTVATAAIEVAAGEAPDVVWADEVLLCGLPAMLAARHVGAKLVLRLTREEAGAGLFDEDFLPILDSCLQAAAIVLVPDEASAVVVTRYCAGKTRVLVAPPRPDAVRQMVASELSKYHSSHGIPWQRESTERIPVSRPTGDGRELEYLEDVIRSGWWGYGPVAHHLEGWFRESLDVPGALALSSCTAALHLALEALKLDPEDEVIVPAMTFVSTATAVLLAGGRPRLADVEPDTLAISANSVEKLLGPRTKAVIVVHFAGVPVDLRSIEDLLDPRGIPIIEDAAHALGASRDGCLVGACSPFACFSFAATKSVAAGAGGMLVFANPDLAPLLRRRSNLGLTADTFQRDQRADAPGNRAEEVGWHYRMDDVTAATVLAQIERLDTKRERRLTLVRHYSERLRADEQCKLLRVPPGAEPAWYIFPIRVPERHRAGIRRRLAQAGIDTSVHYPSLSEQPVLSGCRDPAPVAVAASRQVLSLPLHEDLSCRDVDRVCDVVLSYFNRNRRRVPA